MKGQGKYSKYILVLCNVLLTIAAVLFVLWYSNRVQEKQEQLMQESFCNTVETMKQISERYLSGELSDAADWASYIEREHMSIDEALDYIRSVNSVTDCEAHFIDMDTFEARSTNVVDGSDSVAVYQEFCASDDSRIQEYITRMQKMYNGEKYILGKYRIKESQRNVISLGLRVMLQQEDGTDKGYLLMRAVPVEKMKELWLFPMNFQAAEIGLVSTNGDYVIPSYSMRSENFMEFVRSYNFPDNFNGADEMLAQLREQDSGSLELKNSKGQLCFWYYSRLDTYGNTDILGYIPMAQFHSDAGSLSVVAVVAGVLLLLILIDGSYILSINRQLRVAAREAEKASKAKTQFLSSMSHDIRTPLNAVLGMTELAQSHANDTSYVQECLRKISLSGNHLLTLINDILEISRVESGKIALNPVPFDVKELVSSLESITRSQAVGHGLKFDVVVGNLPHQWLMGDKLRLTQVFLNLLNNAVKYTNPGGTIRLEAREEPTDSDGVTLVCVVADTGIGMSPAFRETMYDSFTRVADSRIDKIQGSGLGLAIVKRMVDLMQGTIDCASTEGVGTTFTVRIPLTAAPASALPHVGAGNEHPVATGDLNGTHLLVAEDNDINWEIISEMLSIYGITCDRAENGQVCVNMLTAAAPGTYDLVLMDIQMPLLNGRDAARALRAGEREDLRRIPIIAMTADAFAEDVQLCLDAGMDAHVAKPVEIDKALAAIRLMLSRKNNSDSRQG